MQLPQELDSAGMRVQLEELVDIAKLNRRLEQDGMVTLYGKLYVAEPGLLAPLGSEGGRVSCDELESDDYPGLLTAATNKAVRVGCVKLQVAQALLVGMCGSAFPWLTDEESVSELYGSQAVLDLHRFLMRPV